MGVFEHHQGRNIGHHQRKWQDHHHQAAHNQLPIGHQEVSPRIWMPKFRYKAKCFVIFDPIRATLPSSLHWRHDATDITQATEAVRQYTEQIKCLGSCHAKSVDESCDFPWIYNVSNGFTVIWLFGQFRWSSCNKLALFSDRKSEYFHLLLCIA